VVGSGFVYGERIGDGGMVGKMMEWRMGAWHVDQRGCHGDFTLKAASRIKSRILLVGFIAESALLH
jgi:hypothetical protein